MSRAATTALVALGHGRSYVGTELNPAYIALTEERLRAVDADFMVPVRVASKPPPPADPRQPGLFDSRGAL